MAIVEDLWRKLEWLEGLLAYAFGRAHFANGTLCGALDVSDTLWSRKKGSRKTTAISPLSAWELGRLFDHFELPRDRLDHDVFRLPFEAFKGALKQAGIGVFSIGDERRIRQELLSDPKHESGGIVCRNHGLRTSRGGFGLQDRQSPAASRPFRVGEGASIHVTIRGAGFLILLNDLMPVGETTCLVPSVFRRQSAVVAGTCAVPSGGIDAFDVLGPPGWYRLFAIWTRRPLRLRRSDVKDLEKAPRPVLGDELARLLADLRQQDDYAILTAEYQVVDRP